MRPLLTAALLLSALTAGKVSVVDSASFEGNLIGWEERPMTKTQMYQHILGLNASQSEWARTVRQRTR